jgi:hypothetical protein
MPNIFADLHCHSTASDGVLSPTELTLAARQTGISAFALTDHDTLKGIPEARAASVRVGLEFVPGIELSCGWPDTDVSLHVVGLFLDETSSVLTELLARQQASRFRRALKMLDLLAGLGIDMQSLREQFDREGDRVLGRPHLARYLVEKGVVGDFQEAFSRFLQRGAPAYVPKDHLPPETAVDLIQRSGGGAFIAHPGLVCHWDEMWNKVRHLPWDGLEVYYSEHSPEQVAFFRGLAGTRGFLSTGGSDYHGEYGKHASRLGLFGLDEPGFRELKAGIDRHRGRDGRQA